MKALLKKCNYAMKDEGNVLFLILIAVALFAALSYAVTSSTRSGGNANSETNLISSAQITQFPASVGMAVVRMTMTGTGEEEVRFNTPPDYATLDFNSLGVFHPAGGSATAVKAPGDIMVSGNATDWVFNADLEIPEIGTAGVGGNDIIAFLIGVRQGVCSKLNEEYGLGTAIPATVDLSALYALTMVDVGGTDYTFPTGNAAVANDIDDVAVGTNVFDGQPFGCFENVAASGVYVYYHVVVER